MTSNEDFTEIEKKIIDFTSKELKKYKYAVTVIDTDSITFIDEKHA